MTPDVSWHGLSIDAPGPPPAELDRTGAVALIPAGDRAFAAAAALTLARSLARHGRRVFLCDLDLAAPRLHIMAGVPRDAGVTDFVLYGASAGHVVTELEERLLFVSSGTPVVAYDAVFGSDRWEALIAAATHARACLLLMVPPEVKGAEAVLARAETLVALGEEDECPDLGDHAPKLRLGFHPHAPAPAPAPPVDAPTPSAVHATIEPARDDDVWSPDPAATGPDPDQEETLSLATAAALNRAHRKASESSERGSRLWLLFLLLVLLAVVVAGWMGWISVPGIVPRRAETSEAVAREAAVDPSSAPAAGLDEASPPPLSDTAPPATPSATDAPVQGWTLRLGAFQNGDVARREAARYGAAAPGHIFAVVPVDIGDTRWFRVVSVVATDEAAAEVERGALASLLEVGSDTSNGWISRSSPFAFLLSEHGSRPEAEARVDALVAEGVDAYLLAVPGADGAPAYRVYAGAYADVAEARAMQELLQEVGLGSALLVERRGTRPE